MILNVVNNIYEKWDCLAKYNNIEKPSHDIEANCPYILDIIECTCTLTMETHTLVKIWSQRLSSN